MKLTASFIPMGEDSLNRTQLAWWRIVRRILVCCIVGIPISGCGLTIYLVFATAVAWKREVGPFEALGAWVVATGGDDAGRFAGGNGVRVIRFQANVGDRELADLAVRMERFPNLQEISLEGTKVTDRGLQHLSGLKQLERLKLNNTKVTEAGKVALQRELPTLEIWLTEFKTR
jgi:hypothetical protein